MEWSEVVTHGSLRNLPFKIELDEDGKIIMTPVKLNHAYLTGEITFLLRQMRSDGRVFVECAIRTRKGTKVADVAWASSDKVAQLRSETDASAAPDVCVEVVSASNTDKEMKIKRKLYFEQGALEVWICDMEGAMRFFNPKRKLKRSQLFPSFPVNIET